MKANSMLHFYRLVENSVIIGVPPTQGCTCVLCLTKTLGGSSHQSCAHSDYWRTTGTLPGNLLLWVHIQGPGIIRKADSTCTEGTVFWARPERSQLLWESRHFLPVRQGNTKGLVTCLEWIIPKKPSMWIPREHL